MSCPIARSIVMFLAVQVASAEISDSASARPALELLPELHMSADLSRYLLPKNDYFREAYFLEGEVMIEPVWVSYADMAYFITVFEINPNMGQKGLRNVLFDPLAVNFAFTTIFEFRFRPLMVHVGEDHRCFHEIDRKDFPTVYWNMLYLAACSRTMRMSVFGPQVVGEVEWSAERRFAWYARWGVFLKGFFDLTTDSNVDFENPRIHEAQLWLRYAVLKRRRFVLASLGRTSVGAWKDGDEVRAYWRQVFGVENSFCGRMGGVSLFVYYFLDDMPPHQKFQSPYHDDPRFSKDRLLEIGIRLYL